MNRNALVLLNKIVLLVYTMMVLVIHIYNKFLQADQVNGGLCKELVRKSRQLAMFQQETTCEPTPTLRQTVCLQGESNTRCDEPQNPKSRLIMHDSNATATLSSIQCNYSVFEFQPTQKPNTLETGDGVLLSNQFKQSKRIHLYY